MQEQTRVVEELAEEERAVFELALRDYLALCEYRRRSRELRARWEALSEAARTRLDELMRKHLTPLAEDEVRTLDALMEVRERRAREYLAAAEAVQQEASAVP